MDRDAVIGSKRFMKRRVRWQLIAAVTHLHGVVITFQGHQLVLRAMFLIRVVFIIVMITMSAPAHHGNVVMEVL